MNVNTVRMFSPFKYQYCYKKMIIWAPPFVILPTRNIRLDDQIGTTGRATQKDNFVCLVKVQVCRMNDNVPCQYNFEFQFHDELTRQSYTNNISAYACINAHEYVPPLIYKEYKTLSVCSEVKPTLHTNREIEMPVALTENAKGE